MPFFLNLFLFCTNRYIHTSLIHSFINIRWGSSPYLHSCGLSGRNLQSFTAGITGRNLNFCNPVNYIKKLPRYNLLPLFSMADSFVQYTSWQCDFLVINIRLSHLTFSVCQSVILGGTLIYALCFIG